MEGEGTRVEGGGEENGGRWEGRHRRASCLEAGW